MQTREIQGSLWNTSPADWAQYIEPNFKPLYYTALKQLRLNENKMLLDAGCGSGLFLGMALASRASVYGFDAAPGLLQISRKRLPGVTLLLEDLEDIPFNDETFDVVTGFNSFQYAGSFEKALREAKRVVKKGGKIVIGIWGKPEECEVSQVQKAILNLLTRSSANTPNSFALIEEGLVESACETVGLKIVNQLSVACPWKFEDEETLQRGFLSTASCAKAVQLHGQSKVMDAIATSAQPFYYNDHGYFMRNQFSLFVAEKI